MQATVEIESGQRFAFGANWLRFLETVDGERIAMAQQDITQMLQVDDLSGLRFLDVGCGSGLSSLAAVRLGATVHSFDYDPSSVGCTQELKRRFEPDNTAWQIEQGSVLDRDYLESLGKYDIVYSWAARHHTGAMWQAIENAMIPVADHGKFFISIYNDQGWKSRVWRQIKKAYCHSPELAKPLLALAIGGATELLGFGRHLFSPIEFVRRRLQYRKLRGMSYWHDVIDWIGGYPFEVASSEEITEFCAGSGLVLDNHKSVGTSSGCNVFVFRRNSHTQFSGIGQR